MSRALLVLDAPDVREKAKRWIDQAPVGTRVEYKAPKRSLEQNAMMWACLTEVADQVTHHGLKLTTDDWKLIFIDALKRENRIAPNLDGTGFVSLGRSTSDLSKDEMTDLIELILAFGAKHGVTFKDHAAANENTNTDDAGPAASEGTGAGEASTPGPASSSLINHLTDFARKGFRTLSDDDLSDDEKAAGLEDMTGTYEGLLETGEISKDDWPKFTSIVTAFKAVFAGKRTVQQGREFAAEVIGCKVSAIGGVA